MALENPLNHKLNSKAQANREVSMTRAIYQRLGLFSWKTESVESPQNCNLRRLLWKALIDVAAEGLLHPSGAPGLFLRT